MKLYKLNKENTKEVMELFCNSFVGDHYYAEFFSNVKTRKEDMANAFQGTISECLSLGMSFGIKESEKLIGFIICFDYKDIKNNNIELFNGIFPKENDKNFMKTYEKLHSSVSSLPGQVVYCLSVAVDEEYRRIGIASELWDCIMKNYQNACFASDVSNENSLNIYKSRGFKIELLDKGYFFVSYTPS